MSEFELILWYPLIYGFLEEQPEDKFTKDLLLGRLREEVRTKSKKAYLEFASMLYWFIHGTKDGLPVFECMELLGKQKTLNLVRYNLIKLLNA